MDLGAAEPDGRHRINNPYKHTRFFQVVLDGVLTKYLTMTMD